MREMEYINEQWRSTLKANHADNFEALWQLQQNQWFEVPNQRRGGWSGVCKTSLVLAEGGEAGIFIKRQENHFYRNWRQFFRQQPTFEREYRNILNFHRRGIPTVDLIYFGQRKVNGKLRAILVTRELEAYQPMGDDRSLLFSTFGIAARKRLFESIAASMRMMHENRFQHGCLYPKHIFVKHQAGDLSQSCFIDLEKARRRLLSRSATIKDLGILYRHTQFCSKADKLRFFLAYRQEQKLSEASKKMLAVITRPKKSRATVNSERYKAVNPGIPVQRGI